MATRYRYSTTLSFGNDEDPGYCELEVTVSYYVLWGRPETPPAYSHGGLPADPDEIYDIRLELVDGKPRPWDRGYGFLTDDALEEVVLDDIDRCFDAMLEEASQQEAAWAE